MDHKHYKVVAMLSRERGLWWIASEGTQTYAQLFGRRTDGSDRFVILYDFVAKDYLLVDMWETQMDQQTLEIYMPEPQRFPTEDAAVMAARLQL